MRFVLTLAAGLIAALASGLPTGSRAADIALVTEEYPPFNMTFNGSVTGLATEKVFAMFKEAEVTYTLQMLPWARAYNMALNQPNTCVFSTTETPERKPLFAWVGPLVDNDWVLIGREGDTYGVTTLEEAKAFKIGGYIGDATAEYMTSQGFSVDLAPNDALNAQKLANGRIAFWATGHRSGLFLADKQGVMGLAPVLTIKSVVMSLACNKATNPEVIDRLRKALASLEAAH